VVDSRNPSRVQEAQWADLYGELLERCYKRFETDGRWPSLEQLQHDFELAERDVDVRALAFGMPRTLGFVEGDRLVLLVRGLRYVHAAQALLDDWHAAVVLAYERWRDDPDSTVGRADLAETFDDAHRVDRVSSILLREGWAFRGGVGGEADDWSRAIHSIVRIARGTRDAADLLARRDKIELPPPSREAEPAGSTLRRVRRALGRVSVHPTGAQVVGGLILAVVLGAATVAGRVVVAGNDSKHDPAAVRDTRPQWGPERPVFRCDPAGQCIGAGHVTLNSTVNNPAVGDERFFVSGVVVGAGGPVTDLIDVDPGDVVRVRMVVVNDAQMERVGSHGSIARGVTARLETPRKPRRILRVYGWLTADNAVPSQVFDTATVRSRQPIRLTLIRGSGRLRNRAHPPGLRLPDELVGNGTLLGYRRLDGTLGGCFCQAGYVLAEFKVDST